MAKLFNKSLVSALSFLFLMAASPITQATENPFGMTDLSTNQMQLAGNDGKCGAGKCGGSSMKKKMEKKEGKCGNSMKKEKASKCGAKHQEESDGKCGGTMKKKMEKKEGKCGS